MATFAIKELEVQFVNGGNQYKDGDGLQASALNEIVGGVLYNNNKIKGIDQTIEQVTLDIRTLNSHINTIYQMIGEQRTFFKHRVTVDVNGEEGYCVFFSPYESSYSSIADIIADGFGYVFNGIEAVHYNVLLVFGNESAIVTVDQYGYTEVLNITLVDDTVE